MQIPGRKNRIKSKVRAGRGYAARRGGHVAGRGMKGQKSRSGHKSMVMFEGGNVPFYRRMPKFRGFKRPQKVEYIAVNVNVLETLFDDGDSVTLDALRKTGRIPTRTEYVKILGYGELTKKLTIQGIPVSGTARDKILAAGGSVA